MYMPDDLDFCVTRFTDACELQCEGKKSNPESLEEQKVLSIRVHTPELFIFYSIPPSFFIFSKNLIVLS